MIDKGSSKNIEIPKIGEGKRGTGGHIAYLLRQANAAVRQELEHALADLGVTPPQFSVLTMLNAYPGVSGADLARLSLLTPQTINLIVRNLEKMKALSKMASAVHGRVITLQLTSHGRALLAKCRSRAETVEKQMSQLLSSNEDAVVRRWLVALATTFQAE